MLINFIRRLVEKGISDKGIIPIDEECAIDGCTEDHWCEVSLVCKLMDDL